MFGSDILLAYGAATAISATSTIVSMMNAMTLWTEMYYDYIFSGDDEKGVLLLKNMAEKLSGQSEGDMWFALWEVAFSILKEYV